MIPCLNRDGDLLSDLVLPLFGSIAGAESVLLSLDAELRPRAAMAEAPHGTAPALEGKDLANPMAMILADAALLHFAAEAAARPAATAGRSRRPRGRSTSRCSRRSPPARGPPISAAMHRRASSRTRVIELIARKLEVWSSLA